MRFVVLSPSTTRRDVGVERGDLRGCEVVIVEAILNEISSALLF